MCEYREKEELIKRHIKHTWWDRFGPREKKLRLMSRPLDRREHSMDRSFEFLALKEGETWMHEVGKEWRVTSPWHRYSLEYNLEQPNHQINHYSAYLITRAFLPNPYAMTAATGSFTSLRTLKPAARAAATRSRSNSGVESHGVVNTTSFAGLPVLLWPKEGGNSPNGRW